MNEIIQDAEFVELTSKYEPLTVTRIHNPINRSDRDITPWVYVPGQSLAEIRSNLPSDVPFAVSLSGITIPEGRLREVFPRPGDHVLFVPVIAGGDDGKMIGRIIGMIIIAVVAWYAAPALVGAMGGTFTAAGAAATTGTMMAVALTSSAIMMVGGLLVNTLLPPPKPKQATLGNNFDNSQTYSWSPQSIQQQGVAKPRWYGRNRLYGNIIGGYLQSDGDKQVINALVSFGTGPYFSIPVSEMLINDQPVQNFNGVTITPRMGWLDQPILDNFTDTMIEHNLSIKVIGGTVYDNKVTYSVNDYVQYSGSKYKCILASTGNLPTNTTYWVLETPTSLYIPSGNTFDGIEVEINFPGGLYKVNQSTGKFETESVNIQVEIIGPDGTINLSTESSRIVEVEKKGWSYGYWQPINSTLLPSGTVYTKAWTEITLGETDYGYDDYNSDGGYLVPYHNEGDAYNSITGASWHFFGTFNSAYITNWGWKSAKIAIHTDSVVTYSTIISNSQKIVRKTWKKTGLTHGTWTVRVTRLTADNTDSFRSTDCFLAMVREIITQKFQYPRTVLCGINAVATDQLSGSLRFSAICDCLYVRVYNSTTSTWSITYSNNPAWVLFDILTQPVYSGNPTDGFTVIRYDGMDPARLDLPKFVEWAEWNNTLCPDGKGGTEKRITFNGGFDSETNLWDAAMQVCQVGGAALVWHGVNLTLAIDKPADPVQLFSVGNTGQDSFSEVFLSMEDRAAEIECDYVNSEKDFSRDKFTVTNPNIKTIMSKVNLPMFGVTKPSEVWRLAKRRLAYNELISRTVTFNADIDAIACTVGDVILLQSDVPQWGFGGRLVSATSTSVVLDQTVALDVGKTYGLLIRGGDDSIIERTVTNAPGATDTLTISSPFTTIPSQYDVYAFGESLIEAKPFRITGIQRADDFSASISTVEYNESVYNTDLDIPTVTTINYSALGQWPTITGLTVSESLSKKVGGGIETILTIYYDSLQDTFRFPKSEVLVSEAGSTYVSKGVFTSNEEVNLSMVVNDGVTYRVAVRALNTIGEYQPINTASVQTLTILGKQAPPGAAVSVSAAVEKNLIRLKINPPSDIDMKSYQIRLGSSFAAGTDIGVLSFPQDTFLYTPLTSGNLQFWVQSIDTSGNVSLTQTGSNVITITAPAFPNGSAITADVVDNNVLLKWVDALGTYPVDVYEIRKGLTFETATIVGTVQGTFSALFEMASGTYKYWVVAKDTAGLYGSPLGVYATVNQPPDYILYDNRNLTWAGTKTNCIVEGTSLITDVNLTETFQQHFVNNSWTTPQAQITAGYPAYIQPGLSTASYVETIDYGATIPATAITLDVNNTAIAGTVTVTPKIETSPDNSTWTTFNGVYTTYSSNFRYVKITLTFTTSDSGVLKINSTTVRLDVKTKTKSYTVTCVSTDVGGTSTNITGDFIKVDAVSQGVIGTTVGIPVVDVVGTSNPTSFKTLLFNTSGTRINGTVTVTLGGV